MKKKIAATWCLLLALLVQVQAQMKMPLLKVSENKRYLETSDGKPFFWLGDTGWLLFVKCNREDAVKYLDARQQQGFNVIQVMLVHDLKNVNVYGDSTLVNQKVSQPNITPGADFNNPAAYDFWDHVDFIVAEAAKRGIYMGLVPVWGSNVKAGGVTVEEATAYGKFLAERYKDKNNIVWLNGGDIEGNIGQPVWEALAASIKKYDTRHLLTYHPRGRYSSSEWFHSASWLDFNMFQSGHRNYAQDTTAKEKNHYGEDNWRYVVKDYSLQPTKPTLDGEPSYENIPQGLHDSLETRWTAADLRRYAYWSVFAGGAGFTYGENAIMQFNTMGDKGANYGVTQNWKQTLFAPGAAQMHFIKDLMLSKSYFDRVPAQDIVYDNKGTRYQYVLATKGHNYAMAYTYTGEDFKIDFNKLGFPVTKASWFNPSTGSTTTAKFKKGNGIVSFNPPGKPAPGHDWVLIIE